MRPSRIKFSTMLLLLTGATSYYYRPLRKNNEINESKSLYTPIEEPFILKLSRTTVMSFITLGSIGFIKILNNFKMYEPLENFEDFMQEVKTSPKLRKRGIVTVANHTSTLDDPILQAAIVGFYPAVFTELHRWGICKENICHGNALSAAFTGVGKALPIVVGDGVEQEKFKFLARRLMEKDWVHIFPEAYCVQSGKLGRNQYVGVRSEEKAKQIGVLKWGVGKIMTHVAYRDEDTGKLVPPLLIPYYHTGMQAIRPHKNLPNDNSYVDPWYIGTGKDIRVKFGRPIQIDDLILEYENKIGKQRRIARIDAETEKMVDWSGSTEEERQLYSKITKRVEDALVQLENEINLLNDSEKKNNN